MTSRSDRHGGERDRIGRRYRGPVLATRSALRLPLSNRCHHWTSAWERPAGTNALLTRQRRHTALLVTEGFGDVLAIGEQDRPDLFSLAIEKPPPLTEEVIEVRERMDARATS